MDKKKKKPYEFWDPAAKREEKSGKREGRGGKREERAGKREERAETRDRNSKAGTRNPKPETQNPKPETTNPEPSSPIRLNRFIAQAGVCSRREADELIKNGKIKVNGSIVTEMGMQIRPDKDQVEYGGKTLRSQQYVYILLNKPKNTLTTTDDPLERKTVMDLIKEATTERVFPVGRLDRKTTGLILLTNDGELTEKLTHPSSKVRKLYQVRLDKVVPEEDLNRLLAGVELEDGLAKADKIDYVEGKTTDEVGIQIHSGKNRMVRRMFEALGYKILSLDRVMIAHLSKKHLPRGKWRLLTEKEVKFLKMI